MMVLKKIKPLNTFKNHQHYTIRCLDHNPITNYKKCVKKIINNNKKINRFGNFYIHFSLYLCQNNKN